MKKSILLSSFLTIALCLSLLVGSTFALFTSESKVNIAVNSGKVEVEATVGDINLYSMGKPQTSGTFENGGFASVVGNQLTISKMTPGDKAEFVINIDNKSNVNTIWRFVWECNEGYDLMSGMVVYINDTKYGAVKSYNSAWATLDSDKVVKIAIELPTDRGNEYQDLETKAVFKVEAVQGNAGYTNPEKVIYIEKAASQDELNEAISKGAETVLLGGGTYKLPSVSKVEIVGNGETVIDGTGRQGLYGADITLTNVIVEGSTENYEGFQHTEKVVFNDCVINNGMFLYADEVEFNNCEFNLSSQYIWTYSAKNVEFNNCVFYTQGKAILIYHEGNNVDQVVNVNDCEFYATKGGYTSDGKHVAAIDIDGSMPSGGEGTYTLNVSGNTVLDSDFNGLYRIKKDGNPSNVTINDQANVKNLHLVYTAEDFTNAIHADEKEINIRLANSIETPLTGGVGTAKTEVVNISALSKDVELVISNASDAYQSSYVTYRTVNPKAVINFTNITLDKSAWSATTWDTYNIEFYTNVNLTNCVVNHPVTFCAEAEVENTVINGYRDNAEHYAVWICVGAKVNINGGEINGNRGIKLDNEYSETSLESTTLEIEGTKFKTEGSKPAILIKMINAEVTVSDVDITEVAKDHVNPVWIADNCPTNGTVTVVVNDTVQDNAAIKEGNILK